MDVVLRKATIADAEPCGVICHKAFTTLAEQHGFPSDFPTLEVGIGFARMALARDDVYAVVAESRGRIAGSSFLWESSRISGVGPITVDPDVQNAAVGRRLMDDVLARAAQNGSIGTRLVQAAYHSRSLSLYAKLGFDVREPLANLQGAPRQRATPGRPVRAATTRDLEACNALCLAIHGHDRAAELAGAITAGTATVVEHGGRITGYATMIGFFGYAVGETNADLAALIAAAPAFPGPGLILPMRNAELFRWCLGEGLRVVQPLTLMTRGFYQDPRGAYLPSILF